MRNKMKDGDMLQSTDIQGLSLFSSIYVPIKRWANLADDPVSYYTVHNRNCILQQIDNELGSFQY